MNKKYLILEAADCGSGIAKIGNLGITSHISFEVENFRPLAQNEVFKNYVITKNSLRPLGVMSGGRDSFSIAGIREIDGVALTRKNLDTEIETIEFWGGGDNVKTVVFDMYTKKDITCEPENLSEKNDCACEPANSKITPATHELPPFFSFDNFFGGGFRWQKISGYYLIYNHKIIRYILSPKDVYDYINYSGFYYIGTASHDNTNYFAIAIPEKRSFGNPFSSCRQCAECTYKIKDDMHTYYTVCAGIDKTGEFFAVL